MQVRGKAPACSGSRLGLYDVRLGEDMHVLVGCGLGGGSLINAGVALRPDPRVFADPVWPGQIAQDGLLEEGFRRAGAWLQPAERSRAPRRTPSTRRWRPPAARSAKDVVAPPITVSFERRVNAAGVAQPACTRCGDCCGGCNVGAKNSVALTYLADAARHGAELFTHAARAPRREGATVAGRCSSRLAWRRRGCARRRSTAPIVVLGAGTLGSTEILLRSRAQGLPLSDRLGERFSANGDIIAFGYGANGPGQRRRHRLSAEAEGVEIGAPSPARSRSTTSDLAQELRVQEGVLPSALAPVLPVLFIPNGRLLGALQEPHQRRLQGPVREAADLLRRLARQRLGPLRARRRPTDARVARRQGRAGLPAPRRRAVRSRAGGRRPYVKNPLAGTVMGHQPATAHPLGGCRHGPRARRRRRQSQGPGVRRAPGRGSTAVHDGLYVVDGAVMPRSLGVNPLLTITALAERAMLHMAQDHGLSFDAEPRGAVAPVSVHAPGNVRTSRRASGRTTRPPTVPHSRPSTSSGLGT